MVTSRQTGVDCRVLPDSDLRLGRVNIDMQSDGVRIWLCTFFHPRLSFPETWNFFPVRADVES